MPAENEKLETNKQTVVAFYKKALFEGDVDTAIRLYGGKTYTQHTHLPRTVLMAFVTT